MSFFESPRFPVEISQGAVGGPQWDTTIVTNKGGYEQRQINLSAPLHRFDVGFGVRTATQKNTLKTFFLVVRGRAHGFRYKDWSDFEAEGEELGEGDGAEDEFQLIKTYTNEAGSYVRTILKPVSGTVTVYIDDTEVDSEDYTLNTATGVITFDTPPAEGEVVSADFQFDVPVRFDTDWAQIETLHADSTGAYNWTGISLVELKEP